MNFIFSLSRRVNPLWPLRLGLGLMYMYSGYHLFYFPSSWTWAIPRWLIPAITSAVSLETFVRAEGIVEFAVALLLLAWFSGAWGVRIAALFSTLQMAAILLLTGIDLITFRDIGVIGGSAALVILSFRGGDVTTTTGDKF